MIELNHQHHTVDDRIRLLVSQTARVTKGTILNLHGLPGGEVDGYQDLHGLFAPRGYRVVSFNYPGLWNASGQFSVENSVNATTTVLDYIQTTFEDQISIFTQSFGAYIGTKVISHVDGIEHMFCRAPLPGMSHYVEDTQLQNQLFQSMLMMVQSGMMDLPHQNIADFLPKESLSQFKQEVDELLSTGIKIHVCIGKNDEIIPLDRVTFAFEEATQLVLFDNLPHNAITRDMWIDLITRADIFFQS